MHIKKFFRLITAQTKAGHQHREAMHPAALWSKKGDWDFVGVVNWPGSGFPFERHNISICDVQKDTVTFPAGG